MSRAAVAIEEFVRRRTPAEPQGGDVVCSVSSPTPARRAPSPDRIHVVADEQSRWRHGRSPIKRSLRPRVCIPRLRLFSRDVRNVPSPLLWLEHVAAQSCEEIFGASLSKSPTRTPAPADWVNPGLRRDIVNVPSGFGRGNPACCPDFRVEALPSRGRCRASVVVRSRRMPRRSPLLEQELRVVAAADTVRACRIPAAAVLR